MCIVGAFYSMHYANQYRKLAESPEYLNIKYDIEKHSNIAQLKKITLQLHSNSIQDAYDNSDTFMGLSEVLIAFSIILVITIILFYKHTVSNKSSNLTGAKNAPPS
jgi:uncharacterized membrane protein affecting hemolysin expression